MRTAVKALGYLVLVVLVTATIVILIGGLGVGIDYLNHKFPVAMAIIGILAAFTGAIFLVEAVRRQK